MSDPSSTFLPARQRVARKRRLPSVGASPVEALVLVAATLEPTVYVDLTFSRAIDVAGMDVSAVFVDDGSVGFRYQGVDEPTLLAPTTVRVMLTGIEDFPGPEVRMTVSPANGIVAENDAGTWAGVTELELPFP